MHRNRVSTFTLVHSVLLCLAGATAWALDPGQPPGSNFDLSHWKEQLPTLNGVLTCSGTGGVDEVKPPQLQAGFTNAYFYTGSDGAMVFWAPINGATTSGNTTSPRSELREEMSPGSDSLNWILFGTHILDAQCKVLQVPTSTKETIIGQIHAQSGAALPTVKVVYNNGKVHSTIKTNSTDDNSDLDSPTVTVGLSNSITYEIKVVNGLVSVVINGKTNSLNVFQTDPNYTNETQYFKAGDYCQANACTNPSNDGAKVAFYAVTLFHAPSITNQPASQAVSVGSNVTFNVGALGNPPLYYAWRLNGTNINNATNATLAIPNVQLTNAGTYSVVVTDSVGTVISAVTSSNATLTVVTPAPVASFTASPTNGAAPLAVAFTDTSSNSPTNWSWTFGDTGTSTSQSPSHTYTTAGSYTVRLIASNTGGSGTNTQTALISVYDPFAWWQLQYFGSTNNNPNAAPGGDYTGTGMSNTNKFLVGLNPISPAAYLHIISIANTNTADINVIYLGANGDSTWSPGIASRTNVLEFTAGAASGDYSNNFVSANVTNILSGGTGTGFVTNMVDAGGAINTPSRYYRVRVLVP
jgi:PKD repeat protein